MFLIGVLNYHCVSILKRFLGLCFSTISCERELLFELTKIAKTNHCHRLHTIAIVDTLLEAEHSTPHT